MTSSGVREAKGLAPTRQVLPNGMTVIAKESRNTPAVTIYAGLHAGTLYDPPALGGVAHFVSRTLDRGTDAHTGDQIAEELDSRGVSLALTVNRHAISLICTCLVEDFEAILGLLAEIIMRPTFPAAEVETRRGEIVTLVRQDADNPAIVAAEALMRSLYGEAHPYGRPMRGTLASVERIDEPALQRFHAQRFVPGAMSLALVGDIDREQAIAMAADTFATWNAQPASAKATAGRPLSDAPLARERRVQVLPMMNKAQADIAYGFTSILRADPRYYAYSLMNNILGQYSLGGRLGETIRERQGMAYYVFSSLDANVIPGPLIVRAGVSPSNVERAVAAIDAELSAMAADGPTEREMAESTQYLIGSMPRTLETNVGIATFLQTSEFFGLGLDYDLRLPDLLRAVTREQVHAAAREALDPSRASVAVAGPYDGDLR